MTRVKWHNGNPGLLLRIMGINFCRDEVGPKAALLSDGVAQNAT